jgi:glycolate oxidase FAD binding subunit
MPETLIDIAERVAAIVGVEHVAREQDGVTVAPADTQQVSEVLRFANEHGLAVMPVGGGTKLGWGNPVAAQIRLSLARLNRVLEHPWEDLTCTVQAGCTWASMQQTLAQHGQFVALDPLWPERATVGGILATNDSGALRHKYGSLRDLVIGMTLVLADGTIARSGGRVVKNVAGYDLCKLMTGSFGTLAVITEATFRLHPLPQHVRTFTVSAPRAQLLAPLMQAIRASHLLTQALQLRGDGDGFHLDVQLNAHPEAGQDAILAEMVTGFGLGVAVNGDEVWSIRESISSQREQVLVKATMLPDQIALFGQEVADMDGISVVQGIGVMYASLPCKSEMDGKLAEEFRYHVGLQGGTTTLIGGLPIATETERWAYIAEGDMPNTLPLMRIIKQQFDPNRTLNPGCFLGGI